VQSLWVNLSGGRDVTQDVLAMLTMPAMPVGPATNVPANRATG
jgi:hypothetical protein